MSIQCHKRRLLQSQLFIHHACLTLLLAQQLNELLAQLFTRQLLLPSKLLDQLLSQIQAEFVSTVALIAVSTGV